MTKLPCSQRTRLTSSANSRNHAWYSLSSSSQSSPYSFWCASSKGGDVTTRSIEFDGKSSRRSRLSPRYAAPLSVEYAAEWERRSVTGDDEVILRSLSPTVVSGATLGISCL